MHIFKKQHLTKSKSYHILIKLTRLTCTILKQIGTHRLGSKYAKKIKKGKLKKYVYIFLKRAFKNIKTK